MVSLQLSEPFAPVRWQDEDNVWRFGKLITTYLYYYGPVHGGHTEYAVIQADDGTFWIVTSADLIIVHSVFNRKD